MVWKMSQWSSFEMIFSRTVSDDTSVSTLGLNSWIKGWYMGPLSDIDISCLNRTQMDGRFIVSMPE